MSSPPIASGSRPDRTSPSQEPILGSHESSYDALPSLHLYPGSRYVYSGFPVNRGSEFTDQDGYNPERYTCKWYGDHQVEQTPRGVNGILIDYDSDLMEHLPEIRPYLYYLGYWGEHEEKKKTQGEYQYSIDRGQAPEKIEQGYVALGRRYLKAAHAEGRGCFVGDREFDFDSEPEPDLRTMPLFQLIESARCEGGKEDVALDGVIHPSGIIGGVLMTNIRVPLPDHDIIEVEPCQARWDQFIQWLYLVPLHPVPGIHNTNRTVFEYRRYRACLGFQLQYLKQEAIYKYPDLNSRFLNYPMDLEQAQAYIAEQDAWYMEHGYKSDETWEGEEDEDEDEEEKEKEEKEEKEKEEKEEKEKE